MLLFNPSNTFFKARLAFVKDEAWRALVTIVSVADTVLASNKLNSLFFNSFIFNCFFAEIKIISGKSINSFFKSFKVSMSILFATKIT